MNGGERMHWVDVAKGICMVLVVLWHASALFLREFPGVADVWAGVNNALVPLRMPLFFFISGLLSVRALARPLRASRGRVLGNAFLYVVWTVLYTSHLWVPASPTYQPELSALDFGLSLLLPTAYWYLYALPVFFIVSWVVVRYLKERAAWALIPMLIVAVLASILGGPLQNLLHEPLNMKTGDVLVNLFWFFLGTQVSQLWLTVIERATVVKSLGAAAIYVVAYLAALRVGVTEEFRLPLSALALYAAANALSFIPESSLFGRSMAAVGRRTFDVYVIHPFFISVIGFLAGILAPMVLAAGSVGEVLIPVLVTAVLVPGSLGVGALLRRSPLRTLVVPPKWVVGPADRTRQSGTA